MTNRENKPNVALPESLKRKLGAFEKRLCAVETSVAIMGGLCGVLITYGLLFASDRLWDTPWWLRAPLTIAGGILFALFAQRWLHHWWWRRRDTRQLAKLIQKQYSGLGDRLLGVVELAEGDELPENISPALCRAAIEQVSREAEPLDFTDAVGRRKPRVYSVVFLALIALTTGLFAVFPQAGWNALLRWMKPLSPVVRYTFVSIEALPSEHVVPHGEPFEIACRVTDQSRWRPVRASCGIKGQPRLVADVSRGEAIFRIPGQTSKGVLQLRIGDVAREIGVIPVYRPELRLLQAEVTLPAYLERPTQTNRIENATASFVEGSSVRFAGEITRDIHAARMEPRPDAIKGQDLRVAGNRFRSGTVAVEKIEACSFSWTDRYDLTALEPYELTVATAKDEPPLVECRGIARAIAVLEDEVVEIDILAEDDFGLRELWVNWSSVESRKRGVQDTHGTQTIQKGSPTTSELSGTFSFSPIAAHVPEETLLSLVAYASDYMPGRKPAMSLIYRIYVLSRAQHAKLIQEQMEGIQARLEDLAREEEDLLSKNLQIAKQTPKDLASDKTTSKLKDSELTERSNQEQLERLSKDGKDLLKEALRNKDVPEKTLAKWSEMVDKMGKLAANQMRQATQSLGKAKRNGGERKESLDTAIQKEKEILEALRDMEKKIDSSIKDMMAKSFINRLRKAASVEQEVAGSMQEILPKTVGISATDLPAELKEEIERNALRQKNTRVDVKYIQDDLAGFHNRTRIEVYHTVHSEMVATNVVKHLTELTDLINQNVGVRAIEQASHWKDHLNTWADFLEKKMDEGATSGGSPGELAQVDLEVLIALMRARQREESIRDQTRVLDERKESNTRYISDSRKMADKQRELATDTAPLERKVRNKRLRRLIDKVGGEMMNASTFLRKPQTDATTIAIETEIIELLSASISNCAKQCGSMGQMMMQAMGMTQQQMMGAGAGSSGGGSMAGGTTTDPNMAITGDAAGEENADRNVEKTGGVDISTLPEEFRDAIEAYFNAVEKP